MSATRRLAAILAADVFGYLCNPFQTTFLQGKNPFQGNQ